MTQATPQQASTTHNYQYKVKFESMKMGSYIKFVIKELVVQNDDAQVLLAELPGILRAVNLQLENFVEENSA